MSKEVASNTAKRFDRSWIIAWSLVALWFLIVFALVIPQLRHCDSLTYPGFLERFLACRTPMDLGDFLAGAFAPPAFVFLIFTVFIQSKELKLQREELRLTRTEASESRLALQDQALQITAQTGLLQLAEQERKSAELIRRFDAFVLRLAGRLKTSREVFRHRDRYGQTRDIGNLVDLAGKFADQSLVQHLGLAVSRTYTTNGIEFPSELSPYESHDPYGFKRVYQALEELIALYDELPPEGKIRADAYDLVPLFYAMQAMAINLDNIDMGVEFGSPPQGWKFDSQGKTIRE
ncbi:hypothetical protein [Rhizobium alvei]|uniref:Uncharacterized protein n=1 Tax=Rhizobium alvei TaxID=1132659 RepID=A0ABT8YQ98_9HYPH|nr:hypothetical protein [Rhizobium alvei]MDO6965792.1 hypothetical protein [Rhizobium alvei]